MWLEISGALFLDGILVAVQSLHHCIDRAIKSLLISRGIYWTFSAVACVMREAESRCMARAVIGVLRAYH